MKFEPAKRIIGLLQSVAFPLTALEIVTLLRQPIGNASSNVIGALCILDERGDIISRKWRCADGKWRRIYSKRRA